LKNVREPLTPAELFFLTNGPDFMSHPAFEGVFPDRGSAGWKVAKLCDQCKRKPDVGRKLWQKHRATLIDRPTVRESWWAFKFYEIFEPELDAYLESLDQ
jgi:hypothetical protein